MNPFTSESRHSGLQGSMKPRQNPEHPHQGRSQFVWKWWSGWT